MKLLALDTSAAACSVALWQDEKILERFEREPRHGERVLGMIESLLADAGVKLTQLDAIGFARGPGSFTSLRIGAGVVQGLAFGADLPVVPISSLAALAQGVDAPKVLAALDARMQQLYCGAYVRSDNGLVALAGEEVVVDPAHVPVLAGHDWIGAGSGWDAYHEALLARLGAAVQRWEPNVAPRASSVARLAVADVAAGKAVAPEAALPVYIRDDVAAKARKA